MLHLLYGPAASGKTDLLMGRIRTAVAARTPGQVLLVPEQYSHEPRAWDWADPLGWTCGYGSCCRRLPYVATFPVAAAIGFSHP